MSINRYKPYQRLLAIALSVAMLLGLLPVSAFAESSALSMVTSGEIIAFEPLPEATANQIVPLGTSIDKLNLPETVTATVYLAAASDVSVPEQKEPAQDSSEPEQQTKTPLTEGEPQSGEGESASGDPAPATTKSVSEPDASGASVQSGQKTNEPETTENTVPVQVTWVPEPEYDGDTVGVYTFTAQVEGFTVSAALPAITVTVEAVPALIAGPLAVTESTDYVDAHGNPQDPVQAIVINNLNKPSSLTDSWYVVKGSVAITDLTVDGNNVNLILADGCTLTANGSINMNGTNGKTGVTVPEGKTLTIYAQSQGANAGTLTATGKSSGAGIGGIAGIDGGSDGGNCGNITINGGTVTATGGSGGAGIGGGSGGNGGNVTINGGTVTADGNWWGSGIGGGGIAGGSGGSGGTVTITGGTVTASSDDGYGAGIGGSFLVSDGTINITGGTVTATGQVGMKSGPNLSGYTDHTVIASTNADGSDPQEYNESDINNYKYLKIAPASNNATLSALTISQCTLSPTFVSGTTSYTASVANSITSLTVTPTASHADATVKVNGIAVTSGSASSPINLSVGNNAIEIEVTAQDGTTKQTYTITVTRAKSSNAALSALSISQGTLSPAFASATYTYTASVAN
ncbi:MAG: cadherin-like beta sandwich domain-containing protein, partial [Dehalobacterium sp.]